jgi:hypothetical protein
MQHAIATTGTPIKFEMRNFTNSYKKIWQITYLILE